MQRNPSFNQIATTLAAGSEASRSVGAVEVPHVSEFDGGHDEDKEKKGQQGKDKQDKQAKKCKRDASCGAKGGCGAGSCG